MKLHELHSEVSPAYGAIVIEKQRPLNFRKTIHWIVNYSNCTGEGTSANYFHCLRMPFSNNQKEFSLEEHLTIEADPKKFISFFKEPFYSVL